MRQVGQVATSPRRGREHPTGVVLDGVLVVCVVAWSLVLLLAHPAPTLRWAVPLVLGLLVVHRVLGLLHDAHRQASVTPRPATATDDHLRSRAA